MHHYFESRELVKAGDYAVRAIRMTVRAGAISDAIELYTYALEMVQNDALSRRKMIAGFQLFLNEFDEFGNLAKTEKRLSINTHEVVNANIDSYHAFTKVGGVYADKVIDAALKDKYNFGQERSTNVQKALRTLESELNGNDQNDKVTLVNQMAAILQDIGAEEIKEVPESKEDVAAVVAPAVPVAAAAAPAVAATKRTQVSPEPAAAGTPRDEQDHAKAALPMGDAKQKQIGSSSMCTVL